MTTEQNTPNECPAEDKWNCKYCKIVDDCALPNADGMINNTRKQLDAEAEHAGQVMGEEEPSTPSANWRELGQADPHGSDYNCERAKLCMGNLTDDELANGAFMNYDRRPPIQSVISGRAHMPIAWMTAVKERIRWLSRRLFEAEQREKKLEVLLNNCLKDWSDDAIHKAIALLKERPAYEPQQTEQA